MAYDHRLIALTAHKMLLAAPRLTLAKAASALGVGRHTATNAVTRHFGFTFRELQRRCLCDRARELLNGEPQVSLKEAAHTLGYNSARKFSKRIGGR